jgi:hypothetical protein
MRLQPCAGWAGRLRENFVADPQVHEEVLRLLSATVGKLSAQQLAKYLQATLQHSRKSRK